MNDQELLKALGDVAENLRQMTTGSDKSMNVAYADETALRPLKTILLNIARNFQGYIDKENAVERKELQTVTAKIEAAKTEAAKTAKTAQRTNDSAQRTLESLENEAKQTAGNTALMVRISQALMAVVSQAAKEVKENTVRFGRFAEDLTRAGVAIQDGGRGFRESLTDSANKIGVKTDDFVKMVTGNSRALARLSASGIDQMAYMTDAMAQYKNVAGTMRDDASAVWEYMAESILRFDTDEQIRSRNMSTEANILLRNFKDLSYATGKSVEELTKEQKARRSKYMEEMFRRTRPEMFQKIMSMDMPEEMREYAMTGRMTAEIQKMAALNPAVAQMMVQFDKMRYDRRYDTMTTEDFGKMMNPMVDRIKGYNQGYVAMGSYYAAAENETLMRLLQFDKLGTTNPQPSGAGGQAEQIGFVETLKKLDVATNTLSNEKMLAVSVSLDTLNKVVNTLTESANMAADALRFAHDKIGDWAAFAIGGGESTAKTAGNAALQFGGGVLQSFFGAKLAGAGAGASGVASALGALAAGVGALGAGGAIGYYGITKTKVGNWLTDKWADSLFSKDRAANEMNSVRANAKRDKFLELQQQYPNASVSEIADMMNGKKPPVSNAVSETAPVASTTEPLAESDNAQMSTRTPQAILEKVSEQLDGILLAMNKAVAQIENDAFERKAARMPPNNMTL